jgi:hypothetical protein
MEQFKLIETSFEQKNRQSKGIHKLSLLLLAVCGFHAANQEQYILLGACVAVFVIVILLFTFKQELIKQPLVNFVLRLAQSSLIGVVGILLLIHGNKISGAGFSLSAIMLIVTGFYELKTAGDRFLQLSDTGLNFTGRNAQSVSWNQVEKVLFTPNLVSITLINGDVVQKSIDLPNNNSKIEILNAFCVGKMSKI